MGGRVKLTGEFEEIGHSGATITFDIRSFRLDGAPVWGLPYRGTEACQEYVQPLLWVTPPDRFSSSMMISRCARW